MYVNEKRSRKYDNLQNAVYEYRSWVPYKLIGGVGEKPEVFSFSNYSNWTEIQNNANYAALHSLNVFELFTLVNSANNIVFQMTAYVWAIFKDEYSVTIAVHCSKRSFCDRFGDPYVCFTHVDRRFTRNNERPVFVTFLFCTRSEALQS